MTNKNHILIVEDDRVISQFIASSLHAAGMQATSCITLADALAALKKFKFQLVVLDLELPDGDGKTLIRELRDHSDIPLIVLSARQSEQEKVTCLNTGADDYLAKPFGVQELLARVRVALRHAAKMALRDDVYSVDGLEINLSTGQISIHGQALRLTPLEFKLLSALAHMPGKIFTHRHLLTTVWGQEYGDETHYLRIHMGRLRAKIEQNPAAPRFILTEAGIGYRLAAN